MLTAITATSCRKPGPTSPGAPVCFPGMHTRFQAKQSLLSHRAFAHTLFLELKCLQLLLCLVVWILLNCCHFLKKKKKIWPSTVRMTFRQLCFLIYFFTKYNLQCCVSFRCTAKWFSYIYIYYSSDSFFNSFFNWSIVDLQCCRQILRQFFSF